MNRALATLAVVLLAAGCGRLQFDPIDLDGDAAGSRGDGDDGTGDGAPPPPGWWDPAWHSRIKLDLSDPGGTLLNVPVLVRLDPSRIDYTRTAASGVDVRFIDADNTTVLAYEIEQWAPPGASVLWVRVPQIDTGIPDHIWLYYENPTAPDGANASALWAGYGLAWHLDDDPAAAAPQIGDSSANSNEGTALGGMTAAAQGAGEIAGSLAFDGNDDWIVGPAATSLRLTGDITIIAWVFRTAASRAEWICEQEGNNHLYELTLDATNHIQLEWEFNGGSDEGVQSSLPLASGIGQWTMVAVVRDTTGKVTRFYENGLPLGTARTFTNDPTGGTTGSFWFAGMMDSTTSKLPFIGRLDEIRIEARGRSDTWIATQFRSMVDNYLGYGAPERY